MVIDNPEEIMHSVRKHADHLPRACLICLLFTIFIGITIIIYFYLPISSVYEKGVFTVGVDWIGLFRPSALALLRGENPYDYGLQNPVWVLFPLIPFALLPTKLGAALMMTSGFFVYGFVANRFGLKWWTIIIFLFSPMVITGSTGGNIDWIVALGFLLPAQIGLFFLILKPQLTIGYIIFLLFEGWHQGRYREVAKTFIPVTLALISTFILWGFWPVRDYGYQIADNGNGSLFPAAFPIGTVLLFHALRSRNPKPAMISSVFLTPYLTYHGYALALLGLDSGLLVVAVITAWAVPFLW
jgi:hypothetical protein